MAIDWWKKKPTPHKRLKSTTKQLEAAEDEIEALQTKLSDLEKQNLALETERDCLKATVDFYVAWEERERARLEAETGWLSAFKIHAMMRNPPEDV